MQVMMSKYCNKLNRNPEEDLHLQTLSKREGKGGGDMNTNLKILTKDADPGIKNINVSTIIDMALCAIILEEEEMF